jgi:hypothetical protein
MSDTPSMHRARAAQAHKHSSAAAGRLLNAARRKQHKQHEAEADCQYHQKHAPLFARLRTVLGVEVISFAAIWMLEIHSLSCSLQGGLACGKESEEAKKKCCEGGNVVLTENANGVTRKVAKKVCRSQRFP